MIDPEEISQMWSPFLNYLIKLEKELKCFICNGLFKKPKLLPCNHIVCSDCIITPLTRQRSVCHSCQNPFRYEDTRDALHVERMVNLFQEMDAAIGSIIQQRSSPKNVPGDKPQGVHNVQDKSSQSCLSKKVSLEGDEPPGLHNVEDKPSHSPLSKKVSLAGDEPERVHNAQNKPSHSGSHGSPSANYRSSKRKVDERNYEAMPNRSTDSEEHLKLKESSNHPSFGENSGSKLQKHDSYPEQNLQASFRMKNGASRLNNFKKAKTPKNAKTRNNASPDNHNGGILYGDECAFCHSFRITEDSGPMKCYKDGKLIALEESNQSNGIYVHEKCVEWAPQVYFSGEIVKNFELELKRASKIKCSKCGVKGAALGCYYSNCLKSYHVTCAVQIPDCRWDCRNFNVLCPCHTSEKLQCDDSGKNDNSTHLQSIQIDSSKPLGKLKDDRSNNSAAAMDVSNEIIFLGSDLMDSEKKLLVELASLIGGKVTERWTHEVTHVIVSTNECGACRRTYDFLLAVLSWKWILTTKWVKVSLESGHLVEEEPFEVRFDEKGFADGPKKRRHNIISKVRAFSLGCSMMFNSIIALFQSCLGYLPFLWQAKNLFAGLRFYISEHFDQSSEQSLRELVVDAGGRVLEADCLVVKYPSPNASSVESFLYFIYNADYLKDNYPRDIMTIKDERCKEVDMFMKTGARPVSNNRVMDAIATLDVKTLDVICLDQVD
ncbi:BRCA1-associated RING domain protein 1-like isoform X1 [Zingiber officinale]|uniref:BRCA1-associated RING domain protein 1-like isoform X1 n=1 Tax=Zingiber officinale TaxID=94328 RepID=UPI001C4D2A7F|nr:BRCA1-associated RING domain protein 1-like isoform X1 [Zingiber officinale]XP_042470541.1 BRCA1-associated RING domain protein 1-like isoform X1 [Zingiber officinale]